MKNNIIVTILSLLLYTAGRAGADGKTNSVPGTTPKSYQIRNVKFHNLLRPEDANSANGTRIVLYPAQPWKCMTWKFFPAGDGVFQLKNHFTSKTFSAGSTNEVLSPVTQVPFGKDASARPAWRFLRLGDGTYEIVEVKSGRSLTANGSEKIVVKTWSETPEQKWELVETDPAKLTM